MYDCFSMLELLQINLRGLANMFQNFYSTQFVEQKELPSGGTKLEYTQNAYIFFAISVPLTLFTIFVWYVWVNLDIILQSFVHCTRVRKVHGNNKDIPSVGNHWPNCHGDQQNV